ncbi:cystatin-C-like [Octodon degus]|uniref:Cystatin-C-like n=1 Tax=Octodon degus TaxID=10160 RepID=A0A6P6EUF2_OCTDE|nr:cystatin-C-like [Octodon degus]
MAQCLRVPLLLLAALVFSLASTPMALKHSKNSLFSTEEQEDADISDKDKQNLVNFALHEYNKENGDLEFSRVAKVLSTRQQVAEGMNYYLDLKIGKTMCGKNRSNSGHCPFSKQPKKICSFVIYSTQHGDFKAIMKSSCQAAKRAQQSKHLQEATLKYWLVGCALGAQYLFILVIDLGSG